MSKHSWKVIAIALVLTASAVIAKSFMSPPMEVVAEPERVATVTPDSITERPMPRLIVETPRPHSAAAQAQPPMPDSPPPVVKPDPVPPKPQAKDGWTVKVVRGNQTEQITYQDAEVKADIQTRD